ncbi:LytR/AlgR family response regulator transcription factor [Belliella aquatica]|uniref:DNA-binding response regulator n=1 Tax=Belliella aquatica TaxID=1323734 RepID=A0ABQ1LM40_9BACT|nr:LytTR family DNA-binding domain-containing protein [Belliella aquatica]MCH7404063.1 LytTR family DNA-binding domain-containing protein [Belliella aquatica]GGC25057.1 DNA-binding response regulator [Belliella aquatica]
MNILIIEDENPAAKRLMQLIKEVLPEAFLYGNLDSIESSIDWLSSNPAPDLIFCDIQLADGLSFSIFENIEVNSPIIFTTAFDQYAIKAFKLNSIDYLLKPIDPKELKHAIEKFQQQTQTPTLDFNKIKEIIQAENKTYKSRFLVKIGEKIQSITTSDAAYFYSEERITFLKTYENKKFILDYTLDQLENMLEPKQFFRLNRKYITSFSSISEIHTYSNSRLKIILKDCLDNDILVSREKVGAFKDWLDG